MNELNDYSLYPYLYDARYFKKLSGSQRRKVTAVRAKMEEFATAYAEIDMETLALRGFLMEYAEVHDAALSVLPETSPARVCLEQAVHCAFASVDHGRLQLPAVQWICNGVDLCIQGLTAAIARG